MQRLRRRQAATIAFACASIAFLTPLHTAEAGKAGRNSGPPSAGKSAALKSTALSATRAVTTTVELDGSVGTVSGGTLLAPGLDGAVSIRPRHGLKVPASTPRHVFYSFDKFDVGAANPVTFSGPQPGDLDVGADFSGLKSVVARVTGGKSNIDGRITVAFDQANPALYLVNPNGIVFGRNASLDVKGAVVLSTASRLDVGDKDMAGVTVDARPEALLRVASIDSFGFGDAPAELSFSARPDGAARFAIADGQTLSMVAGNITVDRTNVVAASGRVNVVSVASAGDVTFDATHLNPESPPQLPEGMTGGDVQVQSVSTKDLTDTATSRGFISTGGIDGDGDLGTGPRGASGVGGRIVLRGGKLTLIGPEARITANTEEPKSGLQAAVPRERGIDIKLSGTLTLAGGKIEANTAHVAPAGAIDITAAALAMEDGSRIDTSARLVNRDVNAAEGIPIGDAGSITIDLGEGPLTMTRTAPTRNEKGVIQVDLVNEIKSNAEDFGVNSFSRGGKITLTAGDINVGLLSRISSNTESGGDAGDISITAKSVTIANPETVVYTNPDGSSETVALGPHGNGGDATNDFRILSVQGNTPAIDATSKSSLTFEMPRSGGGTTRTGAGGAGAVEITADNLTLQRGGRIRVSTMGESLAGIQSVADGVTVVPGGGAAGTVRLTIKENFAAAGNEVGLRSFATGIFANSDFFVADPDDPQLNRESGPAGRIDIRADNIAIADGARIQAEGNNSNFGGGQITIGGVDTARADSLSMSDGGQITTRLDKASAGRAGDILIRAELIDLIDSSSPAPSGRLTERDQDGQATAIKASTVSQKVSSSGGNISIDASVLRINEGAIISANAADVSNQGIIPSADAGSVTILANRLSVSGANARLQSRTEGVGDAGAITILADEIEVSNGGQIAVETRSAGAGGFLDINARNVVVGPGGSITSRSTAQRNTLPTGTSPGRAGNIRLRADDTLAVGGPGALASVSALSQGSDGGNIRVFAGKQVIVYAGGQIITEGSINGGDIRIGGSTGAETPTIAENTAQAEITSGEILLRPDVVVVEAPRGIVADASDVDDARFAGNIFIDLGRTGGYLATDGALSAHSASGPQFDGQILVRSPGDDESIELVEIREGLITVAAQLHDCCELRMSRDLSSFTVRPLPALPFDPAGWRPVMPRTD